MKNKLQLAQKEKLKSKLEWQEEHFGSSEGFEEAYGSIGRDFYAEWWERYNNNEEPYY